MAHESLRERAVPSSPSQPVRVSLSESACPSQPVRVSLSESACPSQPVRVSLSESACPSRSRTGTLNMSADCSRLAAVAAVAAVFVLQVPYPKVGYPSPPGPRSAATYRSATAYRPLEHGCSCCCVCSCCSFCSCCSSCTLLRRRLIRAATTATSKRARHDSRMFSNVLDVTVGFKRFFATRN